MDELTQRETRVVESLLENEALTDNLDDEAAQALLAWGTAYAKQIAQSTAGLNEAEAEAVMDEKLQATRRLLRLVNNYFDPAKRAELEANPPAAREANLRLLQQVVEQVSIILGEQFHPPASEQLAAVATQWAEKKLTPRALIEHLRQFVEQQSSPVAGEEQTGQDSAVGELPITASLVESSPTTIPQDNITLPKQHSTALPMSAGAPPPPFPASSPTPQLQATQDEHQVAADRPALRTHLLGRLRALIKQFLP